MLDEELVCLVEEKPINIQPSKRQGRWCPKMRMMNKGRERYLNNSIDSPISAQEIPSPSLSLNISPTSSFVQKITPELPDLASHHAEMFSASSWQASNFIPSSLILRIITVYHHHRPSISRPPSKHRSLVAYFF